MKDQQIFETYTSREGNNNYQLCSIKSILTFLQLTFVGTHCVGRPGYGCWGYSHREVRQVPILLKKTTFLEKWFQ